MRTTAWRLGSMWLLLFFAGTLRTEETAKRLEPGLAGRSDVLLSTDLEDDGWWRSWGLKKAPENTTLVEGDKAWGGKGRSLQVTVRRGDHMGTSFAYRFRERIGSEPEEI